MIATLLEFSLRQRILILGLPALAPPPVCSRFSRFPSMPIPMSPTQVQVLTEASGLSPVEVERFITYPIELQMNGLPGLTEIRSISKFALSPADGRVRGRCGCVFRPAVGAGTNHGGS